MIFKIDGSIDKPDSLVLTDSDAAAEMSKANWFWDLIRLRVKSNPLIVIGHALRNATAKWLPEARLHSEGAYVTPFVEEIEAAILLKQYNLVGVRADADSFMVSYEQAIYSKKIPPAA